MIRILSKRIYKTGFIGQLPIFKETVRSRLLG